MPPLLLSLDPVAIELEGARVAAQATARLYDFGVVVLALHVPVAGLGWARFADRFNALDASIGGAASSNVWADLLATVSAVIAPACDRPNESVVQEDYLLGIVRTLAEPLDAASLREKADLVRLLSGETRALSAGAQRELMSRAFSYFADDLVVLTWDRAFVYEPRGDSDVADVIEVANAQLVEFRYYDELLDRELPRMYERIGAAQRTTALLAAQRFAQLARRLYTLVAEVTELREKADNALQVTEDVYLARVYAAAIELFRVPNVSAAVDRKLEIVRDTYAALYEEASSRRAEILEIAIIVLIVIEIALAVFRS